MTQHSIVDSLQVQTQYSLTYLPATFTYLQTTFTYLPTTFPFLPATFPNLPASLPGTFIYLEQLLLT